MNELVDRFAEDVDLLLAEVCMTAAFYGLDGAVSGLAASLRDLPGKSGAAALAQSLGKIAVKDYQSAIAFADEVLNDPESARFHHEAGQFRALAAQLAAGEQARPLDVQP